MRERRDALRMIFEVLLAFKKGLSKTQAVRQTNMNFHLMDSFLSLLTTCGYLEQNSTFVPSRAVLTVRGERLLVCLAGTIELEREMNIFKKAPLQEPPMCRPYDVTRPPSELWSGSSRFTQTISVETYDELKRIARGREATVQELLRAIIIPSWLRDNRRSPEL